MQFSKRKIGYVDQCRQSPIRFTVMEYISGVDLVVCGLNVCENTHGLNGPTGCRCVTSPAINCKA